MRAAAALLSAAAAAAGKTCLERCSADGDAPESFYCDDLDHGCNQNPNCAIACAQIAPWAGSEAKCNATCKDASNHCTYTFGNTTLNLCGPCGPDRIMPPGNLDQPWWPPGYELPTCSGNSLQACQTGCKMAFDPSFNPVAPAPSWPPPPSPPAPPKGQTQLNFSSALSSHMVLQRAPAKAAVYGWTGSSGGGADVEVTVGGSATYTVGATVGSDGKWKAVLRAAGAGGNYTITATCKAGCEGSATLSDVTFGDVWYCAGQSNMWLPMKFTYHRKESYASIRAGKYDNIRVAAGDSQKVNDRGGEQYPWLPARLAAAGSSPLDDFSAPCYYFAESLTDLLRQQSSADVDVPPIGLVATAIGGSMIEEWMTQDTVRTCKKAGIMPGDQYPAKLWATNVLPFVDMTVKGWLWYQGENNCGTLHGNSATMTGYGCLMPALVALWREEWSKQPGTTDPQAPFGIVSLSAADSEGNKDMASFRWSQAANYGTLPNEKMPATFQAHGYDLADPWNGHTCSKADPRYDCQQEWFMGPGIHPRLKYPVGQRLAVGAMGVAYGSAEHYGQATVAGCSVAGSGLAVRFDAAQLKGSALAVRDYGGKAERSALSVLVNASLPCADEVAVCPRWAGGGRPRDDGMCCDARGGGCRRVPTLTRCARHDLSALSSARTVSAGATWVPVNIRLAGQTSITADLSPLGGATPVAVRYAWGGGGGDSKDPAGEDVKCCDQASNDDECAPGGCPIFATDKAAVFGGLPANPFIALIEGGKCVCPAPQKCDS